MTGDVLRVLHRNETGGPVLWSYTTDRSWSALFEQGHFNRTRLQVGDLIFANAGYPVQVGILAVLSALPSDVVVAQLCAPVAYEPMTEMSDGSEIP